MAGAAVAKGAAVGAEAKVGTLAALVGAGAGAEHAAANIMTRRATAARE